MVPHHRHSTGQPDASHIYTSLHSSYHTPHLSLSPHPKLNSTWVWFTGDHLIKMAQANWSESRGGRGREEESRLPCSTFPRRCTLLTPAPAPTSSSVTKFQFQYKMGTGSSKASQACKISVTSDHGKWHGYSNRKDMSWSQ